MGKDDGNDGGPAAPAAAAVAESVYDAETEQTTEEAPVQTEAKAQPQETEEFRPEEQQINEILGELMNFESDEVKDILLNSISDKEKFVDLYKQFIEEKNATDDITAAQQLESKFKDIDDEMKSLFVTGDCKEHYRIHEKTIIKIATKINENLEGKVTAYINGSVSVRETKRVMSELKFKIRGYEAKLKHTNKRVKLYKQQMDGLETRIKNDHFELQIYALGIEKTNQKLTEMDEEEAQLLNDGKKKEADNVAERREAVVKDLEKMVDKKAYLSQEVNKNAAIFYRKEVNHAKSKFAAGECQLALNAAKSHHEIAENMLDDYKHGTPIEIQDGRIMISEIRKRDGKMKVIDQKTFSALEDAYSTPRNQVGLDTQYVGGELESLKASSMKAIEDSYNQASMNAEKIINRRRRAS